MKNFAICNISLIDTENENLFESLVTKDAKQIYDALWQKKGLDSYGVKMLVKSIYAPIVEFFIYKIPILY